MCVIDISELSVILTAKIDNLQSQMEAAKKSVEGFRSGVESSNAGIASSFGNLLTKVAGTFLIWETFKKVVIDTIQISSQFEASMVEVAHATGATGEQLAILQQYAIHAGTQFGYSGLEMTKAMVSLGREGMTTAEQMNTVLVPAMQLGVVAGTSLEHSTDMIMTTMHEFGLNTSSAAHISAVFADAQEHSKLKAEGLHEALHALSPVISSHHQNLDSVAAVLETVALKTGNTHTATLGYMMLMRQMDSSLDSNSVATNKLGQRLVEVGVTHKQVAEAMKDPIKALDLMKEAHITATNASQVFQGRIAQSIGALLANSDAAKDTAEKIKGLKDASEDASADLNTLEGRNRVLHASWQELQLTIGSRLVPALKILVGSFIPVIQMLLENKDLMNGLLTIVELVGKGFILLSGAVSGAASTIGLFSAAVKLMKGDVKGAFDEGSKAMKGIIDNAVVTKKHMDDYTASMKQAGLAIQKVAQLGVEDTEAQKAAAKAAAETAAERSKIEEKLKVKLIELEGDKVAILKAKQKEELDNYIAVLGKYSSLVRELKLDQAKQVADEENKINRDLQIKKLEEEGKTLQALKLKQQQELIDYKKTTSDKVKQDQLLSTQKQHYMKEAVAYEIEKLKESATWNTMTADQQMATLEKIKNFDIACLDERSAAHKAFVDTQKNQSTQMENDLKTYFIGPASEGFTTMFKGIIDGTGTATATIESFAKAMTKAVLKGLAQMAEGYVWGAMGKAASEGTLGMVLEAPAILAATVAAAALEGLAASFAQGGIVSKPTLAMIGDRPEAPEVVMGLDQLSDLIKPRVINDGRQTPVNEPTNQTTLNLNFQYRPGMSFASPAEMRKATQVIINGLQNFGYTIKGKS